MPTTEELIAEAEQELRIHQWTTGWAEPLAERLLEHLKSARRDALQEAVTAILTGDYNRPPAGVLGLSKSDAYAAGKRSALEAIRGLIADEGGTP